MAAKSDAVRIAALALSRAKKDWGTGWKMLSVEQRRGAVALAVGYIMMGWENHQNHISTQVMQEALRKLA